MNAYLDIKEEVKAALAEGKPVVALESTIISHGMPFPQNLEMVHRCESLIRAQGAIPATIALMDGKIKVGLSEEEVMTLAKATDVVKVVAQRFRRSARQSKNRCDNGSGNDDRCGDGGDSLLCDRRYRRRSSRI